MHNAMLPARIKGISMRIPSLQLPPLARRHRRGSICCLATDPCFGPLARWIEEAGGQVKGLDLRACQMGAALVRGLVATADRAKGSALLSVPLSRTLRDDRMPEAYPGAPWNVSMATYLIEQSDKGEASEWAPYLASLPRDLSTDGAAQAAIEAAGMLGLEPAEVLEVQYAPAVEALKAYQQQSRKAYKEWQRAGGWEVGMPASSDPFSRPLLAAASRGEHQQVA